MFKILKSVIIFITLLSIHGFTENVHFVDPTSTPTGTIPDLAASGTQLQITTDSSGRYVYAIWEDLIGSKPIQVAISQDFGKTFKDPTATPTGTIPDLAVSGTNSQITTDSSGRYVYAIWVNVVGGIFPIQVAISDDFGKTFKNPTTTPTGTIPNLAVFGFSPQITTDSSGRYVYAIWRDLIGSNPIQVAISDDFGKNWTNPTSTPAGSPDLAASGDTPQITTDSSGRYIYAIWRSSTDKVQVAISEDFGNTWQNPTSTPSISPTLAVGTNPQIIADSSGRYVYAIWRDLIGSNPIQVAISDDFGKNWTNPTSTPAGIPDLAASGDTPQITIDSSGRYVYAIWKGSANKIQAAISDDFGKTFKDPTTTPTGTTPNLAVGTVPQITTDSSGRYVYAIWQESANKIQVAISDDFGKTFKDPTTTPTGTTPNLADSGVIPQIIIDSSGRYVYAIWQDLSGANPIQVAIGFRTFFPIKNMSFDNP